MGTDENMCFKWPYVVFLGLKKDFLILINVYEPNSIHRIKLNSNA